MRTKALMGLLAFLLLPGSTIAQAQAPESVDISRMEATLKEASDLQVAQPQDVPAKLAPLLGDLRQIQQKGALNPSLSKVYQEALLLLMRTQTKLLLAETEVLASFRELLILNPKIDESIFNPREKLLLDKVRSAETSRLSLRVNPPGSTVYYMGMELGAPPLEIPLIAGTYRFMVRKTGYFDQEVEATLKPSEIATVERTLRRRTVEIPLSIHTTGVSISLNGQIIGTSQPYSAWLAALPENRRQDLGAIVSQWNVDVASSSFFRLPEIPVGEAMTLEFRAACYESRTVKFSVGEQEVDWNHPILVRGELKSVELKKDTGFVEVTSNPAGAEAWIDGVLQGKTPVGRDLCVGMHRVQVLHRSGQYVAEVIVKRGQVSKVSGELKPSLAFLGMYNDGNTGGVVQPLLSEWEAVSRRLILRSTAFMIPQLPADEVESMRKRGSLPIERLLEKAAISADTDLLVKKIASEAGKVDLLLIGMRSGDKYLFRLYSTLHTIPDLIQVPNLEESSMEFLTSQLNRAERAGDRLKMAELGLELLDSAKGLLVLKVDQPRFVGKAPLVPGLTIRTIDQKMMGFAELQAYLRTKQEGQTITLEVASSKEAISTVLVPLRFEGAEYPWSTPEAFPNAVLAMLYHISEREPLSAAAKYASLGIARGLMQRAEWKPALEFLAKTNLEPHKFGVCPGTVLYYQGRCYEELGDRIQAENYYNRAKDFPEATLGTPRGLPVPSLAEQRSQSLKKASR